MAKTASITIPIHTTFDEELRDLLDRAASQLEFHAAQGFEGASSSEEVADEIRAWLEVGS